MTTNSPSARLDGPSVDELVVAHGRRLLMLSPDGPPIRTHVDAVNVIGAAWSAAADLLVIPVSRLPADFFDLSTRVAGEIVQKLVDYRADAAVLGDIAAHLKRSSALRAFVAESNRGSSLWFLADRDELDARLATPSGSAQHPATD